MAIAVAEIRDAPGYKVRSDGVVIGRRGWALRPYEIKGGYLRLKVLDHQKLVHVLVAEAFLGPKPDGHQVNHIDGDKKNNAVENLEYVTPSENVRHSIDVLRTTRAPGVRNANAKINDDIVRQIRAQFAKGLPWAVIGDQFGICESHVWRIATYRAWRHVK